MESYEYYQFLETITVEEFAPDAYHFYGVLNGKMVEGAYIYNHGILVFSDDEDYNAQVMEDIGEIIEEKIEELKEEESL